MKIGAEIQPDLLTGVPLRSLRHRDGLKTEQAALDAVAPKLVAMRKRILAAVDAAGGYGVTPDEWCDRQHALINTVRRRFTDLWKLGLIRHHPQQLTRKNRAGNECIVWVIGRDPVAERRCELCGQKLRGES